MSDVTQALREISLDDKFDAGSGKVFLSGTQALVRLPMIQIRRDRARGWNTAGFISGYRGSPLGAYDMQLGREKARLREHDIEFMPAINEDLAASAVWGSQQVHLSKAPTKDGVFGIWYGKSPGVDRSGDALKHANAAGTSPKGGVLCLAGDDHTCKSSSLPHQSDQAFIAASIPMLYPSSIHEFVEMGLLGLEMSRFSGCWIGFKVIADTVETTSVVDLATEARQFILPDFDMPQGGLGLRYPDPPLAQDERLQLYKLPAVLAFARANAVNRLVLKAKRKRFGIVASGKALEDVREALCLLGISEVEREEIGLWLFKVGMPWPLEPEGITEFANGLDEILVVEERRDVIEGQLKSCLFNRPGPRPVVVGKTDEKGLPLLSSIEALTAESIAMALVSRLNRLEIDSNLFCQIAERAAAVLVQAGRASAETPPVVRTPYFCAGCPHNTSTKVPDGSRALSGIGCHFMAQWMDRETATYTHMGAEGVPWTAQHRFTDEDHVFVNIGDGTYFHSGTLAIRQSVASGANVTYKVLYNDAVAMTGGQPFDGELTPQRVTHQLASEGVQPIYLVTDQPAAYSRSELAPGTEIAHREELDAVMRNLREVKGCSGIVYVQTCAAEKRRRRKRKLMDDPDMRVAINENVCEGCGDCSVQSNCVAVEPLETLFGRKRQINHSTCNKDFSCLKGFCPSFVTLRGAKPRKAAGSKPPAIESLPFPAIHPLSSPWNIVVAGVGGTGVLTVGAIVGMAAHIENKACTILDMAGLAQKGGAVLSHIRLARTTTEIRASRVPTGAANVVLAADDVVASSQESIALCSSEQTEAVLNTSVTPTAEFVLDGAFDFKSRATRSRIEKSVRNAKHFHDFSAAALSVTGDSIAANILMLGYAWQNGLIPLQLTSLVEAIELNGTAVQASLDAFTWGRVMAIDPSRVPAKATSERVLSVLTLSEIIHHRKEHLANYQSARLSEKYEAAIHRLEQAAARLSNVEMRETILRAAALGYARLLSYKDEYETARLFLESGFLDDVRSRFEGQIRISFNLAPPLLPGKDANGRPRKREFGPWIVPLLRLLIRFKGLRGSIVDPFGWTAERRQERSWITRYEAALEATFACLSDETAAAALALLNLPENIRGFGPVKQATMANAEREYLVLMNSLTKSGSYDQPSLAAE